MIRKQINKSILILFLVFPYANITFSFWPFEWNIAFSVFPNFKNPIFVKLQARNRSWLYLFPTRHYLHPFFFSEIKLFLAKRIFTLKTKSIQYSNYQNLGVKFSIFWETENYLRKIRKMRGIFSIFWEKNKKWELN